jgi:hypothetical protein
VALHFEKLESQARVLSDRLGKKVTVSKGDFGTYKIYVGRTWISSELTIREAWEGILIAERILEVRDRMRKEVSP